MSTPAAIRDLLADALVAERRFAWARLDADQHVIEAGGALPGGELAGLQVGADARQVLPWLVGLLPLSGDHTALPRIALGSGAALDVLLRRADNGGSLLLLLDASAEQQREAQLLQRANELTLLRRQLASGQRVTETLSQDSASLADLLHALDMCGVEWHHHDRLLPIGAIPVWAQRFADALGSGDDELFGDPAFAFLGSFIFEARDFWRSQRVGALPSGLWIDTDPLGAEYTFEATAVNAGARHLLLIERNSRSSLEKADLIRTGRGQALQSRERERSRTAVEQHASELDQRVQARTAELETTHQQLASSVQEQARLQTERGAIIERAQTAQHIEALGTLTGGIAHDFNNVLTAIIGFADLGASEAPPGSRQQDHFRFVLQAGERARSLIREIMTISARGQSRREHVSLRDVVNEVLGLVRATMPKHVGVQVNLESAAVVQANPTQLHQLVLNLCTNAIHAIGATPGMLTLTLDEIQVDAEETPDALAGAGHARLRVRDTGHGMSADVRARIFDPFFTTKPAGQGTGIGLSVVQNIVAQSQARIQVYSEPGAGATFELLWPLADRAEVALPEPEPGAVAGTERILFVDEDPLQAELARRMLGGLGYEVLALCDARDAVQQLRQPRGTWDLLITDQSMPGVTGASLAREVLRTQPGFPVIVCSGNVSPDMVDNLLSMGVREVLFKPVRWRLLAEAIRRCLHSGPEDAHQQL